MAYSDGDIEDFIRKAEEIRAKKDENFLSEKDLENLAKSLGFEFADLIQARKDYLEKANRYLSYQNYERAIKEFESYLELAPNSPDGFLGIAKASHGIWQQKGDEKYKKAALHFAEKCIEFNPKEDEAYRLIQKINNKTSHKSKSNIPKTRPSSTSKEANNSARLVVVAVALFLVLLGGLIPFFILQKVDNQFDDIADYQAEGYTLETAKLLVFPSTKGYVAWHLSYWKDPDYNTARDTTLTIIDLKHTDVESSRSTEILLEQPFLENILNLGQERFYLQNDKTLYVFFNNQEQPFLAWDIRTAELVNNASIMKDRLESTFKISVGEIGTVQIDRNNPYLNFVTKEGEKYFYSFENNEIFSGNEYPQKVSQAIQNQWFMNEEGRKKIFYYASSFLYTETTEMGSGGAVMTVTSDSILANLQLDGKELPVAYSEGLIDAQFFMGNEKQVIVRHLSEIGAEADTLFSAISIRGETLWTVNIHDDDWFTRWNQSHRAKRYDIASHSTKDEWAIAVVPGGIFGLDMQTGEVTWEWESEEVLERVEELE